MEKIKLKGLKKLCSDTKNLSGYYSGEYLQINYEITTGEVWGNYHYSLGQNSWSEYHDKNIINCGNVSNPHTMKELVEIINEALMERGLI